MDKYQSKYFNTAKLMDEALIHILETKDFEYITVKEICQKAGVNRSTFYLHYENMNDLLEETISLINENFYGSFEGASINEILNSNDLEDLKLIKPKYLIPYLNYVKGNKRIFKLVNQKKEVFKSQETFMHLYKNIFQVILNKFKIPKNKQDYIFSFYFQGTLAIIYKWLDNDCKDDINFIIDMILDCTKMCS